MTEHVNWGIIGCGNIAGKFARCIDLVEGAAIVAVASATPGKAEKFASQHSIASAYDNYQRLVDRDDVQAVYVATTHNFHYENVKLGLAHGKAVLCEKPITVAAWEAEDLVELARRQKVFLMEAMWSRFLPAITQVREWLADGAIGGLRQIQASFGGDIAFDPVGRMYNRKLAGGALLAAGIYPVSFASMVAGAPAVVEAIAEIGSTGVDEQSSYLFRYHNGAIASLSATFRAKVDIQAHIIGSEGMITVPDFVWARRAVLHRFEERETLQKEFPFPDGYGFEHEIKEVVNCMRQGRLESPVMPLNETVSIMQTMDTIRGRLGLVYDNDR